MVVVHRGGKPHGLDVNPSSAPGEGPFFQQRLVNCLYLEGDGAVPEPDAAQVGLGKAQHLPGGAAQGRKVDQVEVGLEAVCTDLAGRGGQSALV